MQKLYTHFSLAPSSRLCYTFIMADEESLPAGSGQAMVLQEAIEALRRGERTRARELLTRQLKTDHDNALNWVWLSAAVDTPKERLYCLQTALQLDPQNAAAKRGLILMGGLPPDDAVPPFPLNHPRLWEEVLSVPEEAKPARSGLAHPVQTLFVILLVSAVLLAGAYFGFLAPNAFIPAFLNRPRRLLVTLTSTPTGGLYTTSLSKLPEPTPLELLLSTTYTPTPLYVLTQHPITSRSAYQAGLDFFKAHDYKEAITQFNQVLNAEPHAADAEYYIGESYRMQKDYTDARAAYQTAINDVGTFAPGYLGRALSNLGLNPYADVSNDLDSAINLDSHFTAAYLERSSYRRTHNDPTGAMQDVQTALELNPDSALAYMILAQVELDSGDNQDALAAAIKANHIDLTVVPAYLVLAQAYIANGQIGEATGPLQTYARYAPNDIPALLTLGTVDNAVGQYAAAQDALNRYLQDYPKSAEAYCQRGYSYLGLKNASLAEIDFKKSVGNNPDYFEGYIGLGQAYFAEGSANNAYIVVVQNGEPLMSTDNQRAEVYYWEAVYLEKMGQGDASMASWRRLLTLPEGAMSANWRNEAFLKLGINPTPTPSLGYSLTPNETQTPTP
jgi:tetratricopeptide (TPR) repeat protein